MIHQVLSGQLTKQLIQDLDCSIALNKGFVLALNYEIRLLKLNSSEHIKVFHYSQSQKDRAYTMINATKRRGGKTYVIGSPLPKVLTIIDQYNKEKYDTKGHRSYKK